MGGSIRLSKKHGVNPHLTICPRCGGDSNELILTGAAHKFECSWCHQIMLGLPKDGRCPKCERSFRGFPPISHGEMKPDEKMLATQPCDKCKEEIASFTLEISRGGIPVRCKDCGMEGVIKAEHPMARAVRKQNDGKTVGLEFTKDNCPKCGPNPVKEDT
jgi:Zn finger protein HypA/HybF involved in hydrogenase expression